MSGAGHPHAVKGAVPSLDKTGKVVARALKVSPEALLAGFKTATLADLPLILRLRAQVLGANITWDDEAYLSWRYRLGRDASGPERHGGDCFVLVLEGQLLGLIGTEDITLRSGGTSVSGIRVMDLLIRPDLSDIGLGVWISLLLKSRHELVLAVGANANSKGLVTRLFDVLPNRQIWVSPIRFDRILAKRIPMAPLAWLGARLANAAIWGLRAWGLGVASQGVAVERLPALPDQLDALLRAAVGPDLIDVVRSRDSLAWRLGSPRGQFDIWAARQQGELVGLMLTRRDPLADGQLVWTVMDAVLDRRCTMAAGQALFRTVFGAARQQGVEQLVMPSYRHDLDALMRKAGFVERPNELKVMAWSCQNEALRVRGEAGADWTFNEVHDDSSG